MPILAKFQLYRGVNKLISLTKRPFNQVRSANKRKFKWILVVIGTDCIDKSNYYMITTTMVLACFSNNIANGNAKYEKFSFP